MDPDFSGLTILEDQLDGTALSLFIAYAKKFSKKFYKLCVVDDERSERILRKMLRDDSLDVLRIDEDPLGWDGTGESSSGVLQSPDYFVEAIRKRLDGTNGRKAVLLFPNLSFLWITFNHEETMRFLVKIRSSGDHKGELTMSATLTHVPVLAVINGQLLTESQADQFKYISTAWVLPAKAKDANVGETVLQRVNVQCKQKKGAKINEKAFTVDITNAFDLVTATKSVFVESSVELSSTGQQPDLTTGLTFNLRLKDTEAMAKRNVQLPHLVIRDSMRKQIREDEETVLKPPGGQVFYTPDEADDFDDEDPDADLDI